MALTQLVSLLLASCLLKFVHTLSGFPIFNYPAVPAVVLRVSCSPFAGGNMDNNVQLPISDTPVTRLSKIFSQTSFSDTIMVEDFNRSAFHLSKQIPPDIDESANQEPPTNNHTWVESVGFLRESSSSCSSGYFSSVPSRSAPPSCDSRRKSEGCAYNGDIKSKITNEHSISPTKDIKLRRTKSCTNRSWLLKKHKHSEWPKISGISKTTLRDNSIPILLDTNSCPASIPCTRQFHSIVNRFSLPPVGESTSSVPGEVDSPEKVVMNFSSDDSIKLHNDEDDQDLRPAFKKQRIKSPVVIDDIVQPPETSLNSTFIVEDEVDLSVDVTQRHEETKPSHHLFRHHSTPMPSGCLSAMQQRSPIVKNKSQLHASQCLPNHSTVICDKLANCISALDNQSFCPDGRRARALAVVDRTTSGLHCITTDTVADLVRNSSQQKVKHVIVDCRFPYEYEGGHIKGAINIFTHSELVQEIFDRVPAQRPPGSPGPPRLLGEGLARRLAMTQREPLSAPCELISDNESDDSYETFDSTSECSELDMSNQQSTAYDQLQHSQSQPDGSHVSGNVITTMETTAQDTPFIVIFHCEFSSQRAPALATFLRTVDRVSNCHRYPFLYFPEIYVMKGGYSAFYEKFQYLCTPQAYVKMFHRGYRNHLRLYRRITRRVSSACLACIKPQLSEWIQYNQLKVEPPGLNLSLDSPNLGPVLHAKPTLPNSMLLSMGSNRVGTVFTSDDKENMKPPISNEFHQNPRDVEHMQTLQSPESCGTNSRFERGNSFPNSPLNLAEVVVRIGRRVMATTLCKCDPTTSEIASVLDQIKQRALVRALEPSARPALKRSLTTTALHEKPQSSVFPRSNLDLSFEGNCLTQTPDFTRYRRNLLSGAQLSETPVFIREPKSKSTKSKSVSGVTRSSHHSLSWSSD